MVKKKKTDPEIYIRALKETGLRAEECMVIEDSLNGVEAANAGGRKVGKWMSKKQSWPGS